MAVSQIFNGNFISDQYFSDVSITNKVKLGEGLTLKEDGKIHRTLAEENEELKDKVEALEERLEELEEYIGYLKQTYVIEFEDGSTIPET